MSLVKRSVHSKKKRRKILKFTSGYYGRIGNCYKLAKQHYEKSLQYHYIHRKQKKRTFRSDQIVRINAAVRSLGITYSKFIHLTKQAGIELDRKSMADLAYRDPMVFKEIISNILQKTANE